MQRERDALALADKGVERENKYQDNVYASGDEYAVVAEKDRYSAEYGKPYSTRLEKAQDDSRKGYPPPEALKVPDFVRRVMPSQWVETAKADIKTTKQTVSDTTSSILKGSIDNVGKIASFIDKALTPKELPPSSKDDK